MRLATDQQDVVKFQAALSNVGSVLRAYTTSLVREIVMPSKDTSARRAYYAAYRRANKQRAAQQISTRIARNRAFVDEINARTVCAHCGAQPIEWHNPEHVEQNRERFRIGHMVHRPRAIDAIAAELARCTPLCRRCHMREDGRMKNLQVGAKVVGPSPCVKCGRVYKPLRRGLCSRCRFDKRYPRNG